MKSNFHFDKKTGTIVQTDNAKVEQVTTTDNKQEILEVSQSPITPPTFQQEKRIEPKKATVNTGQDNILRMMRVSTPTPVQLIDKNGLPESYLDAVSTGVMMFREKEDYDICQISDERTGTPIAYIGGYALQFNFNMAELNTMERIEQFLEGIKKLFRHQIMNQNLQNNSFGS